MPNKPVSQIATEERAIALIEDYLGSQTARQYERFYADKNEKQILDSVRELLVEITGPQKATRLMHEYFNI